MAGSCNLVIQSLPKLDSQDPTAVAVEAHYESAFCTNSLA